MSDKAMFIIQYYQMRMDTWLGWFLQIERVLYCR